MQKDSRLKANLVNFFAEWWFAVRVLWLCPNPRPGSDYTEPKPPNTLAMIQELFNSFAKRWLGVW